MNSIEPTLPLPSRTLAPEIAIGSDQADPESSLLWCERLGRTPDGSERFYVRNGA